MNISIGKRLLFGLSLLCIFFLLALDGHGAEKGDSKSSSARIDAGKEILVARDIGNGDVIFDWRWCGNNGLLYRGDNVGVEVLDIPGRKRTRMPLNREDTLLNCTPDGKRVLYMDAKSHYADDNKTKDLVEMYAYDIASGEKALVARVRSWATYDAISPDGKKVLLGQRNRLAEQVAMEWEGIWYTEKWHPIKGEWFPDSTGVVAFGDGYSNSMCVEVFGKDGWAGCFDLMGNATVFRPDRGEDIYVLEENWIDAGYRHLHRCGIRDRELYCERVLKEYDDITPFFGILADGGIVFQDNNDNDCIRRSSPGAEDARCMAYPRYGDVEYEGLGLIGVSPDGRWVVFYRYGDKERRDLFVIDTKTD